MLSAQHTGQWGCFAHPPRLRNGLAAGVVAVLLVGGVATTDLLTSNVNLSILYAIPILLAARMRSVCLVWVLALAMTVLSYIGYLFGPHVPSNSDGWLGLIWNYRMVNRTLAVAAILAVAVMIHFWIVLQNRANGHAHPPGRHDLEQETIKEVTRSFEIFGAALICGLIMACIALTDLLSPGEFNLPILYAVPLMICGAVHSRSLLWSILPFLLILTMIGFVIGPKSAWSESIFQSLVTNRFLAAAVQVLLALLSHVWIGEDRHHFSRV